MILPNINLARWVLEGRKNGPRPFEMELIPAYSCNLNCSICGQKYDFYGPLLADIKWMESELHITAEDRNVIEEIVRKNPKFYNDSGTAEKLLKIGLTKNQMLLLIRVWLENEFITFHRLLKSAPVEKWEKVAESAVEAGVRKVTITGGEPLYFWDVTKAMMRILKESDVEGTIITNGTLIDREKAEYMVKIGWDKVLVSLDGGEDAHDRIRGKGNYRRTIAGMKALKASKDASKSRKPEIGLNCVVNAANYSQLHKVLDVALTVGAKKISFSSLMLFTPGAEELQLNSEQEEEARKELATIQKECSRHGIMTNAGVMAEAELTVPKPKKRALVLHELISGMDSAEVARDTLIEAIAEGNSDTSERTWVKDWTCYESEVSGYVTPDMKLAPCCFFYPEDAIELKEGSILETYRSQEWAELSVRVNSTEPYEPCKSCSGWPRDRAAAIEKALPVAGVPGSGIIPRIYRRLTDMYPRLVIPAPLLRLAEGVLVSLTEKKDK